MAFVLKGLGDQATGKNEILPSADALFFDFIVGIPGCVLKNKLWEFAVTFVDRGVRLRPGAMQAYGYLGISDSDYQVSFHEVVTTQYATIYAEVNLSTTPHEFSIKATAVTSSSAPAVLVQDDLRTNNSGVYQLPLFRVQLNANGTITQHADLRPFADKIAQAESVSTSIAGRLISNIFESNTDVKKATNATNATNADTAAKAATIEFVTTAPTSSPPAGTLRIYIGSTLPSTRYDRVLYLVTM